MEKREVKKRAVILVSTDKGLCGALEQQPDARSGEVRQEHDGFHHAPDAKASQFIARTKRQLAAEFTYKDAPMFAEARAISKFAQEMFLKGEVDAVDILFTNFITRLTQKPEVMPFLPVGEIKGVQAGVHAPTNRNAGRAGDWNIHFRAERGSGAGRVAAALS